MWVSSRPRLLVILSLLSTNFLVKAEDHVFEWDLEAVLDNDLSPDCMNIKDNRRFLFLANRSLPGPVIDVTEGDSLTIRVTNHHPTEGVSIHWHGLHQRGTPYMDGPAGVTQCPLGPMKTQEYVFEATPVGTHYWHAHGSLHLADGLSGAIVVRPKEPEPFEYDEEYIVYLQDWYLQTSTQQLVGLLNFPFTWIGNPSSLLINGKGLAPACLEGGARAGDPMFCIPEACQVNLTDALDAFHVTAGKTYRLRIINAGQLVMQNVAIANHTLTIVQVEGTDIDPFVTVESLDIAPGQRYDVLVTANQVPGTYLMETTVRQRNVPGLTGQALFHYDEAPLENPDTSPDHPDWEDPTPGIEVETSLYTANPADHVYESPALNATNIKRLIVVGTQNLLLDGDGDPELLVWAVNNLTNAKGSSPLIGSAVQTARELGWPTDIPDTTPMSESPPFVWNYTERVQDPGGPGAAVGAKGQAVVSLEQGEVLEIVLQNARALNGVAEFHPWHVHGHSFWVVGSGDGIFDPDTDPDTYNLDNPILRDTVNVWPLQWTAVRLVADNPGVWFFHCHITAHLVMGMGFYLIVAPDELEDPSESVRHCESNGLETDIREVTDPENSAAMTMASATVWSLAIGLLAWL